MMGTVNRARRCLLFATSALCLAKFAHAASASCPGAIDVEEFGAREGEDSTSAIQRAIDSHPLIHIAAGKTYLVNSLTVPSDRTIVIDGTLLRIPDAPSDSYMITNAGGASGNANIVIAGDGELDGNASNQAGDRQGLIRLLKPVDCAVRIRKAGSNRYSAHNPTTNGHGCIVFIDAVRSHISVAILSLWQREGIYVDGASTECSITGVRAVGDGLNSWTATSISGAGATINKISDIVAENCGASSVGLDSTYSDVANITSRNNQFHNGVNFGHKGKPATGSRATKIRVIGAGQSASNGTTHNGISIGGDTTDFELSDVTVSGAHGHCINISDGAARIRLNGENSLSGSRYGSGVHAFAANDVHLFGVISTNNADFGVNFNGSDNCSVVGSDLRGNKTDAFNADGTNIKLRQTRCSDDPTSGGLPVPADALRRGGTVVIENRNLYGRSSAIKLGASGEAVVAASPYVLSQALGHFVISFNETPRHSEGSGHYLDYEIL